MSQGLERNKALVREAMISLFQGRNASAIARLYAPDYIQHSPALPQGRDALEAWVRQLPAQLYYEPGMIIAEGAFVAIHGRIRAGTAPSRISLDVFRIDDGRLAEHWNVVQDEIPADASASGLAMFDPQEGGAQVAANTAARAADDPAIDYDALMQANLVRVFGEHDPGKRLAAIRALYTDDAAFIEPHGVVSGHDAINEAVSTLLAALPPTFQFAPLGRAIGHHGVGRLRWRSGTPGGPAAITGMDLAHFQGHRIGALQVFIDPPAG